ncbi:3-hydroxybutyryl-CoA dehydrogenase [Devosia subaequoris]|uniref:3-hydroxybutyryl-CoA dehydrogenase n=1 Tax=Devosia subaequoris TaxID=395930 RepID=A0A7W6IQR0_9HYPH|nr:3-hydroxybutyryl-CoA dehydrogenase [Devosia subaequoris]MCP1211294.1 3-hydroxyacyl-CoA dehydrogenase [Devosia subaequoris]
MTDLTHNDLVIGIVGAGAMGSGIAQVAAASGRTVLIFDQRHGAASTARAGIITRMEKRVAEGKASQDVVDMLVAKLQVVESLSALAGCGLIVEAIIEDLDAKRALFAELAAMVAKDTVLASNTSSIPIGAIASGLPNPSRISGLHFFNPVPVMKLVEVIRTPDTADEVVDGLMHLSREMGRVPVEVRDTPGFLVNFGGRAYTTEGLAIVHENVATPAQVDAVMRDCCGFRMGPFELMDLTGMDINYPVTALVHQSHFSDPRLRSTPLHRYLFDVGQLGRKTGRGFFDYRDGAARPSADATSSAPPAHTVSLLEANEALVALARELDLSVLPADDGVCPILCAPIGEDCAALSERTGADHRRLVALDLAVDTTRRITVMTAPDADPAARDSVVALLLQSRAVTAIADSPGFIAQRICAMIANLGCEMAQTGLAKPNDIDTAMRLGLNYPSGPLEMTDAMGADQLYTIMTQIQRLTGDDRYRPSQWLRRRAQLGLSAMAS